MIALAMLLDRAFPRWLWARRWAWRQTDRATSEDDMVLRVWPKRIYRIRAHIVEVRKGQPKIWLDDDA